jgi:hypothetical protein
LPTDGATVRQHLQHPFHFYAIFAAVTRHNRVQAAQVVDFAVRREPIDDGGERPATVAFDDEIDAVQAARVRFVRLNRVAVKRNSKIEFDK